MRAYEPSADVQVRSWCQHKTGTLARAAICAAVTGCDQVVLGDDPGGVAGPESPARTAGSPTRGGHCFA